jgi:hypothetical protein
MSSKLNQLPEPFGYVSDWFGAPDGLMRFSHTPFPELHNLTHSVCSVFSVPQVLDVQQQAYAAGKAARIAELEAEINEQARLNGMGAERELALIAERDSLARWKSTNAPRIDALEGLKNKARADAAKGAEAILSLASERKANAILTSEVEALRAEVERLQRAITKFCKTHNWADDEWKALSNIKPLFDITRAIEAAKEAK